MRATRLLGQQGYRSEQTQFVRALAESLQNDTERTLAIEFGQQMVNELTPQVTQLLADLKREFGGKI